MKGVQLIKWRGEITMPHGLVTTQAGAGVYGSLWLIEMQFDPVTTIHLTIHYTDPQGERGTATVDKPGAQPPPSEPTPEQA